MKRVSLGSQDLVTGDNVADALAVYIPSVERMNASVMVDVPVLDAHGSIVTHTLLIGSSNDLRITDLDGNDPDLEGRFRVPHLPAVGGKARAAETSDIPIISPPFPGDGTH